MNAGREFSLPELADDIREMRSDLRAMRTDLERTYVRQDVYEAHRSAVTIEMAAMREQLGGFRSGWRQFLTSVAAPIVTGVVVAVLVVLVTRGGI